MWTTHAIREEDPVPRGTPLLYVGPSMFHVERRPFHVKRRRGRKRPRAIPPLMLEHDQAQGLQRSGMTFTSEQGLVVRLALMS